MSEETILIQDEDSPREAEQEKSDLKAEFDDLPDFLGSLEVNGVTLDGSSFLNASSRRSMAFKRRSDAVNFPQQPVLDSVGVSALRKRSNAERTFFNKRAKAENAPALEDAANNDFVVDEPRPDFVPEKQKDWSHLSFGGEPEPKRAEQVHGGTSTTLEYSSLESSQSRALTQDLPSSEPRGLRRKLSTFSRRKDKNAKRNIRKVLSDQDVRDDFAGHPVEVRLVEETAEEKKEYNPEMFKIEDWETSEIVSHIVFIQKCFRRWSSKRRVIRMRKQSRRRNDILKEILFTERRYVKGLDTLMKLYVRPLEEQLSTSPQDALLTRDEMQTIFSNVHLIVNLNKELLSQLEACYADWDQRFSLLGPIFLELAPFLKFYTQYCSNHETAMQRVSELSRSRPRFARFMQTAKMHPDSQNHDLLDLLITPVQRIPRYLLLLTDFAKNTQPNHRDSPQLEKALAIVRDVADHVNKSFHQAESMNKIIEIQRLVVGDYINLVEPARRFVRQGSLVKNGQTRQYFLFTDLILWAQKLLASASYKYRGHIFIDTTWINDVSDEPGIRNTFQIVSELKTYTVRAESQAEKEAWMETINRCIDALVEKDPSLKSKRAPVRRRMKRQLFKTRSHIPRASDATSAESVMPPKSDIASDVRPRATLSGGRIFVTPVPATFTNPPRLVRSMITNEEAEGHLKKQGITFSSWRNRLFILKDQFLYYFREKKATAEPAGIIPIRGATIAGAENYAKKKYCFEVRTKGRTFYIIARNENMQNYWMQLLDTASHATPEIAPSGVDCVLCNLYQGHPRVQHQAAVLLREFTQKLTPDDNAGEHCSLLLEKEHGLPVILNALLVISDESTLLELAVLILHMTQLEIRAALALRNDQLYLDTLVYRLRTHSILHIVLDILVSLTCDHGDTLKMRRAQIRSERFVWQQENTLNSMTQGAMIRLLLFLIQKSEIEFVREQALVELANLSADSFLRVAIFDAGAISVILENIRSGNALCKGHAARALGNLARNDKNRKLIGRDAVLPLISLLSLSRDHSYSLAIAEHAAFALKNLAIDDNHRQPIIESVGLPPLIALLSSKRESLVLEAVEALRYFAYADSGKEAILDAGGLPRLIELLQTPNVLIQEHIARILSNLCYNERIEENISDLDGLSPLLNILGTAAPRDRERHSLVEQVLRALTSASNTDVTNREIILDSGVASILAHLLASSYSSLVEHSLQLLSNLAQLPMGARRIRESGCVGALIDILSSHRRKWVMRVTALRALHFLVADDGVCQEILSSDLPLLGDFVESSSENSVFVTQICQRLQIDVPAATTSYEQEVLRKEHEEEVAKLEREAVEEKAKERERVAAAKGKTADVTGYIQPTADAKPSAEESFASAPARSSISRRKTLSAPALPTLGGMEPAKVDATSLVVAEWAWEAGDEEEVELIEGDEVRVFLRADDDWWYGEVIRSGQRGYFPAMYVRASEN